MPLAETNHDTSASILEREDLERVLELLDQASDGETIRLATSDGSTELPESLQSLLREIIPMMIGNQAIRVVPTDAELSTQEAAAILKVSRQHLVDLLDAGEMPHHKVGTHRRVLLQDVLRYREQRRIARHEALDDLARMSFDEGMYDKHHTTD